MTEFFFLKKIFSAPTIIYMPTTFWLIFHFVLVSTSAHGHRPHGHSTSTTSPLTEKLLFTIRSFGQLQPTDASSKYLHAAVAVDELLEQTGCHLPSLSKDGVVKLQSNAYTKQESNSTLPRWMQNAPNLAASIRPSYRLQQIFTEFRLESISID